MGLVLQKLNNYWENPSLIMMAYVFTQFAGLLSIFLILWYIARQIATRGEAITKEWRTPNLRVMFVALPLQLVLLGTAIAFWHRDAAKGLWVNQCEF